MEMRNNLKFILSLFVFVITVHLNAQEVTKSLLIVNSTKSYSSALKTAQSVANKMVIPLNLRNCYEDKEQGLASFEVCGCGEAHGYIPRGRSDDGEYVSIEFSSAYGNFSPGYYIVVLSSGESDKVKTLLPKAKEFNKSAYIKKSNVYMGCMH